MEIHCCRCGYLTGLFVANLILLQNKSVLHKSFHMGRLDVKYHTSMCVNSVVSKFCMVAVIQGWVGEVYEFNMSSVGWWYDLVWSPLCDIVNTLHGRMSFKISPGGMKFSCNTIDMWLYTWIMAIGHNCATGICKFVCTFMENIGVDGPKCPHLQ